MTTKTKAKTAPQKSSVTTAKKSKADTAQMVLGKAELARRISEKMETSQTQADSFLNAYMATVFEALTEGRSITLVGFGTLEVRERSARTGRNPQTGEVIQIAATKAVGFRVGSQLKHAVAGTAQKTKK